MYTVVPSTRTSNACLNIICQLLRNLGSVMIPPPTLKWIFISTAISIQYHHHGHLLLSALSLKYHSVDWNKPILSSYAKFWITRAYKVITGTVFFSIHFWMPALHWEVPCSSHRESWAQSSTIIIIFDGLLWSTSGLLWSTSPFLVLKISMNIYF